MVNKTEVTQKAYTQIHVYLSVEEAERWRAFKEAKYNGLNAMSMMIRNFVNEGMERETIEYNTTHTTKI